MGKGEIIEVTSTSSEGEEEGEERTQEEEEGEEDGRLSTNDKNKEEEKRERSIIRQGGGEEGGGGGGPSNSYSNCSFPMTRIKRLMKNEGVLQFRTTPDFVFLINKASEHFLELFVEDAYAYAARERKKSLNYDHLSSVVSKEKRYEFLSDFVPEKVRAKDALSAKLLNES